MPITPLPAAPSRAVPATFSTLADAWVAALAAFTTEANALEVAVNADEASVSINAPLAEAAAATAQAAANYIGDWSAQTGAKTVPTSVSHGGSYWQLESDIADITAKEPGVDSEWIAVGFNNPHVTGYITGAQNIPDLAAKGAGYWVDGVNDYININAVAVALMSASNTKGAIVWRGQIYDFTSDYKELWTFGDANVAERIGLNIAATDYKLRGVASVAADNKWIFTTDNIFSEDVEYTIILVQNGTEPTLYVNGLLEPITFSLSTDKTVWFHDTTGIDRGRIGCLNYFNDVNSNFLNCAIHYFGVFNLVFTATEVKAFSSGAPVPYKYIGASQTLIVPSDDCANDDTANWTDINGALTDNGTEYTYTVTTGTSVASFTDEAALVVGKRYRATVLVKDGTGAGATVAINAQTNAGVKLVGGTEITVAAAFATASVEWTATETNNKVSIEIVAGSVGNGETVLFDEIECNSIGCVLQLEQPGIGHSQWLDTSGNELHGTVSGAIPINLGAQHTETYVDLAVTGNTSFTLPKGYMISSIIVKETATNALTGGLDCGLSANGVEVISAMAIGASATVNCTLVEAGRIGGTFTTADDTIYFSDGDDDTNWNSASLEIRVTMQKITMN